MNKSAPHPGPPDPDDSPVGRGLARPEAKRLLAGCGCYSADLQLPRMLHVAFVRSPYAHAVIRAIDSNAAKNQPGVVGVFCAADLAAVCTPMQVRLEHLPQHRSPPQSALADTKALWQGEPVVALVADSRSAAEDAAEHIQIDWRELPAVADPAAALSRDSNIIHDSLDGNLAFTLRVGAEQNTEQSDAIVVERDFEFGRHTGVALETRTVLADYSAADDSLSVYQSHQSPHLMQAIYARHLGIPEQRVRVICKDVGGAFGTKLHVYGDELAVVAIAKLLRRPIKYVCDRLEAFVSDIHTREFRASAKISADADGRLDTLQVDLLGALGAYSIYPRASLGDGIQSATMCALPYRIGSVQAQLRLAYQNKTPTGVYRGVGQPIACTIGEQMIDDLAAALNIDAVEFRRRNYLRDEDFPHTSAAGLRLPRLSLHECLDRLCELMDYASLRREQQTLRARQVYRGIGVATFVEQTGVGAQIYGPSGQPITAQDNCTLKLEPSGAVRCQVGCTDQGQGTLTGIAQIVAATLGIGFEQVAVSAGDSAGPYGGGAWASRGLSVSGEAAHSAAKQLRAKILIIAAAILQTSAEQLDLSNHQIVDKTTRRPRTTLAEVCRLAFFSQHLLPPGVATDLSAQGHFVPRDPPYAMANGIQASYLEVDIETGFVRLIKHWVVEDCGRIVNPLLVDEQIRGGVVQGLGAVLFEHCVYDAQGQLQNGTLADYLVPMAAEMPDIEVAHVTTAQEGSALGIKGVGEAGTVGAGAAVWCALNDALRPLDVKVSRQPFTPAVILSALGKV